MTKERFDKIEKLFESFQKGYPDESGMQEFISLTARLEPSANWSVLRVRFKHFLTLKQASARVKRWDRFYQDAKGVYLEILRSMPRTEDGGIGVQ